MFCAPGCHIHMRLLPLHLNSMANDNNANSYEEVRRQRVLDNKKRFEDLGILKISKNLSDLTKSEKKTDQKSELRRVRQKSNDAFMLEPRRSSRARNPVQSYRDELDIELPSLRKRSKFSSSWASYLARPLEEVKTASYKERAKAFKCAEKLMSNLQSGNPSFVKSMVRSHVYSCFWLGLPNTFCENHLPKSTVDIVLVNEEGSEYEAVFIGKRTGVSGGWRAFALDHKLDDGDALVFELVERTKFKIYIVRASQCSSGVDISGADKGESEAEETPKSETKQRKKTLNKAKGSDAEKGESEAKETSKRATRQRNKSSNKEDSSGADKEESEAEETSKSGTKQRKKTLNKAKGPSAENGGSDAKEKSKRATRQRNKSSYKEDSSGADKEESEAEETSKSGTKQRKKTLNKDKGSSAEKGESEAKETSKRAATRQRNKSSYKEDSSGVEKEESEAEETLKSVTRKRKKSRTESKVSTMAKEEISPVVSATRRSTRRK